MVGTASYICFEPDGQRNSHSPDIVYVVTREPMGKMVSIQDYRRVFMRRSVSDSIGTCVDGGCDGMVKVKVKVFALVVVGCPL